MLDKLKEKPGMKKGADSDKGQENKSEVNESCNAKECLCVKQQIHANVRKHCLHYGVK